MGLNTLARPKSATTAVMFCKCERGGGGRGKGDHGGDGGGGGGGGGKEGGGEQGGGGCVVGERKRERVDPKSR